MRRVQERKEPSFSAYRSANRVRRISVRSRLLFGLSMAKGKASSFREGVLMERKKSVRQFCDLF